VEDRRKPIPSGRKGIIEIYASFRPRSLNLQRSRPATNVIQPNMRKQAEAIVSHRQNQRKDAVSVDGGGMASTKIVW
jgi:hypothetical protein